MFTILSRREAGSDKCPRCSRLNVDFVDLGLGMLGCFDCGSVFLRKSDRIRAKFTEKKAVITVAEAMEAGRQLAKEVFSEVPVITDVVAPVFTCGTCGKVLKTKLALSGHMRSHK